MPKSGFPLEISSIIISESPLSLSFAIASPKAPTPGKIILSACEIISLSELTIASSPIFLRELASENKFPTP